MGIQLHFPVIGLGVVGWGGGGVGLVGSRQGSGELRCTPGIALLQAFQNRMLGV